MNHRIRAAGPDDLNPVLAVLAENEAAPPPHHAAAPTAPSTAQIAMWRRIMNTPDVTVYLAETAGDPVGTACLSILPNLTYDCRPTAFIEAVVVRYRHRRRGVARLLLGRALEDARRQSCYKVQCSPTSATPTTAPTTCTAHWGSRPRPKGSGPIWTIGPPDRKRSRSNDRDHVGAPSGTRTLEARTS